MREARHWRQDRVSRATALMSEASFFSAVTWRFHDRWGGMVNSYVVTVVETWAQCSCPDSVYRPELNGWCKHAIAFVIAEGGSDTMRRTWETRWVPEDSVAVTEPDVDAVVFRTARPGKDGGMIHCGVAYHGKANKPDWNYRFRSEAEADKTIARFFEGHRNWQQAKDARKAEAKEARAKGHGLEVGCIVHYSWGYDQTNPEFWEVIEKKGKTMVVLREIAQITVKATGPMASQVTCRPGVFLEKGEPVTKRVNVSKYEPKGSVSFDFGSGSYWGTAEEPGRSQYNSDYA